jgi:hypothetical protein
MAMRDESWPSAQAPEWAFFAQRYGGFLANVSVAANFNPIFNLGFKE